MTTYGVPTPGPSARALGAGVPGRAPLVSTVSRATRSSSTAAGTASPDLSRIEDEDEDEDMDRPFPSSRRRATPDGRCGPPHIEARSHASDG